MHALFLGGLVSGKEAAQRVERLHPARPLLGEHLLHQGLDPAVLLRQRVPDLFHRNCHDGLLRWLTNDSGCLPIAARG